MLARIRDCVAKGCLPRCPKVGPFLCLLSRGPGALTHGEIVSAPPLHSQCFGGRLKLKNKLYVCPGAYEDDKFVRCSYKSKECERVPWKKADGECV